MNTEGYAGHAADPGKKRQHVRVPVEDRQEGPGPARREQLLQDPVRLVLLPLPGHRRAEQQVQVSQELDASETERRRQRNCVRFELAVRSDLARRRLATTVGAGGRLLDEAEDRWRVCDPKATNW